MSVSHSRIRADIFCIREVLSAIVVYSHLYSGHSVRPVTEAVPINITINQHLYISQGPPLTIFTIKYLSLSNLYYFA